MSWPLPLLRAILSVRMQALSFNMHAARGAESRNALTALEELNISIDQIMVEERVALPNSDLNPKTTL
jgi:hypothetical protein